MRIPPPDTFQREPGYDTAPPWRARVPDAGCVLFVPDSGGEPDLESLAFARRVLARLGELRDLGVQHITHAVQTRAFRMEAQAPEVYAVFCEAGSGTVMVEMTWEADLHNVWHVTFRDHPTLGPRPQAFGCGAAGSSTPPWRVPAPPL
jgi:hypothetical protein